MTARSSRPQATRVLLRLPADLHRSLTRAARAARLSFNEFCVRRLAGAPVAGPVDRWDAARAAVVAHAREIVGDALIGMVAIGSWVRGEAGPASDVDVLVVVDHRVALTRDLYRRWDRAPLAVDGRSVDAHFVHLPAEGALPGAVWCEAGVDGLVWFDVRGDVAAALTDARRAMAEGRVVRAFAHGHPYWKGAEADHLARASARLAALDVLFDRASWADVVRESQEAVELALKGLLRSCGIEPPRIHDVADVLRAEREHLPAALAPHLDRLAGVSRQLRRDRELAFYGAEDLTPSTFYREADAVQARSSARDVVTTVQSVLAATDGAPADASTPPDAPA